MPPLTPGVIGLQVPLGVSVHAPVVKLYVKVEALQAAKGLPPLPVSSSAEQPAVEPPLLPAQVQSHGPLPVTAEAVPALHRLAVGALLAAVPFAEPQAPLTKPPSDELPLEEEDEPSVA